MIVSVTAEAAVEPTEDEQKVERALLKLFPSGRVERRMEEGSTVGLVVRGTGLEFLANLRSVIRQERIRNTARVLFLRNASDRLLRIYVNKQAAFMGRVSFCAPFGESPHGPISIAVETDGMQAAIDYLAAKPVQSFGPDVRRRRKPSAYLEEE
jgi:hypothetical protein